MDDVHRVRCVAFLAVVVDEDHLNHPVARSPAFDKVFVVFLAAREAVTGLPYDGLYLRNRATVFRGVAAVPVIPSKKNVKRHGC